MTHSNGLKFLYTILILATLPKLFFSYAQTITAERSFNIPNGETANCYEPSEVLEITISITTNGNFGSYTATEFIPDDWTYVENSADNAGRFSQTENRIRWVGFAAPPSALKYQVTPASTGPVIFSGTINGRPPQSDNILGTFPNTMLAQCGPPNLISALVQPENSELDVVQGSLSRVVSNGANSGDFSATLTASGSPNQPSIDTTEFRVITAAAGGPPWAASGTVDASTSPTFEDGNDGWQPINLVASDTPVVITVNDHTFNITLSTTATVAENITPTISWNVPTDFVETDTVYLMQIRTNATFNTTPFEEIAEWAFNVVDEPLPTVTAFELTGGDDTVTDINAVNVSASDANDPDSAITFTYQWFVNDTGAGAITLAGVAGTNNDWTAVVPLLGNDQFRKGDVVRLEVSARNALDQQGETASAEKTIGNFVPVVTITSVTVSPADANSDTQQLTGSVDAESIVDEDVADGVDTLTNIYQWQRSIQGGEFINIPGASSTILEPGGLNPPAETFTKGDQFKILFAVNDGEENSVFNASNPVTIGNSPPVGESEKIIAVVNETTDFVLEGSDTDSDDLTFSIAKGIEENVTFRAVLDGASERPNPVTTDATGVANFCFRYR